MAQALLKKLALKHQNAEDTSTNRSVGYIENRAEKQEVTPTEPIGHDYVFDGEIEHIHHFAVQKSAIALAKSG